MTNKSKKISSEISAGELLDKMSILEIKMDKIKDTNGLNEINTDKLKYCDHMAGWGKIITNPVTNDRIFTDDPPSWANYQLIQSGDDVTSVLNTIQSVSGSAVCR